MEGQKTGAKDGGKDEASLKGFKDEERIERKAW